MILHSITKKNTKRTLLIIFFYFILTLVFTYPLISNFTTHIPAKNISDSGVFVWNSWNFKTNLLNQPYNPFLAPTIIYPFEPNLVLHAYTVFRNILILFLTAFFNLITSHNIVTILMFTFSGYGAYLLTLRFVKNHYAAFVSGMIFSFCPFKLGRLGGHFNFIDSAFIPFYILFLYKSFEEKGAKNPLLAGIFLSFIGYCSYYYLSFVLLFTLILICFYTFPDLSTFIEKRRFRKKNKIKLNILSGIAGIPFLLIILYLIFIDSIRSPLLNINRLEIPIFILSVLLILRICLIYKIKLKNLIISIKNNIVSFTKRGIIYNFVILFLVFFVLFSPILINLLTFEQDSIHKLKTIRSYPEYQDLFSISSLSTLNKHILKTRKGYILSRVVYLGFFVFLMSLYSVIFIKKKIHIKFWFLVASLFVVFALGPTVISYGRELLWGPYNILQKIPFIKGARQPARFIIMTMLGLGILTSFSIEHLFSKLKSVKSSNAWKPILSILVLVVISIEYITIPLSIYDFTPPKFYQKIAKCPENIALFEIPWSIPRKGRTTIGRYTKGIGLFQYYQSVHNKILLSGKVDYPPSGIKNYYEKNEFIDTVGILQDKNSQNKIKTARKRSESDYPTKKFLDLYNIRYIILHKKFLFGKSQYSLEYYLNGQIPNLVLEEDNDELLIYKLPKNRENEFLNKNLLNPENEMTLIIGWSALSQYKNRKVRSAVKKNAKVVFPVKSEKDLCLKVVTFLPLDIQRDTQNMKIFVNNSLISKIDILSYNAYRNKNTYTVKIPKETLNLGANIITFEFKRLFRNEVAALFTRIEIDHMNP